MDVRGSNVVATPASNYGTSIHHSSRSLAWCQYCRDRISAVEIDGRTVLVSGGASGLGGATAEMIVAGGGRVVILDVNEENGRAHAERLGSAAAFVRADVTSSDEVQSAIERALQRFGTIGPPA